MIKDLNPWQRFWGIFATVILASSLVLIVALWPRSDAGVVADIESPACRSWMELPADVFPDAEPDSSEPCHALRSFLYRSHTAVDSTDDYDSYRLRTGIGNAVTVMLWWAGSVGAMYLFGWAGARITGTLLRKRQALEESVKRSQAAPTTPSDTTS